MIVDNWKKVAADRKQWERIVQAVGQQACSADEYILMCSFTTAVVCAATMCYTVEYRNFI